ncbi:MAG TPA: hypothetical protein VFW23_14135, partial [Tepidisphaeraceae bacterium]|nr:hypothetical protein [Tepidisphaeraceae bacterium]
QSSYAGQKHPFFQALCSDFESIDGLLLPRVVDEQVQSEYKGTLFVPFEEVIQVDNYRINGDDNSQGSYSLQWPSNSSLKDMRTGILLRPPTTRPISDAEIVATVPLRQTSPVTRGWTGAQISLTAVTAILGILTLLYIRRDARKTS